MPDLITLTDAGLYCAEGDFYIDPWRPVERAVVTHAHGDHAYFGSKTYYCATKALGLMQTRLGPEMVIEPKDYGESFDFGTTRVSLHSAGHILGSSQVRVESAKTGDVWVASGDYKRGADLSCDPFEVVSCNTFITEATFGLPIYRWQPSSDVAKEILAWWQANTDLGVASVVFCYSLGKAQRILAELAQLTHRPVYLHGAAVNLVAQYRKVGVRMLETIPVSETQKGHVFAGELILAPPSAFRSSWMKRLEPFKTAFASGWMRVRGARRQRGYDHGFVMSDHADWAELLQTIQDTGAERILATHGNTDTLVRYLNTEMGIRADALRTRYGGDTEDETQ